MNTNLKAFEQVAVVGRIDPDVQTAAAYSTGWIPAKDFAVFLAVVMAGTLGASATLDGKLEQATDGSGTGVKDIVGKLITQLTQAGTDSDKDATISLRCTELDIKGGFTHFRLTITVGTATSDAGALVLGLAPRSSPATDTDLATVDENVA